MSNSSIACLETTTDNTKQSPRCGGYVGVS